MSKVTKEQYEFALARIEELCPLLMEIHQQPIKIWWSYRLFFSW